MPLREPRQSAAVTDRPVIVRWWQDGVRCVPGRRLDVLASITTVYSATIACVSVPGPHARYTGHSRIALVKPDPLQDRADSGVHPTPSWPGPQREPSCSKWMWSSSYTVAFLVHSLSSGDGNDD